MGGPHDILIPGNTSWLNDPRARAVCEAVKEGGFQIYFVGGCVRNALLGLADSDVDMSTNARPDDVIRLTKAAGLKAIPTGIDHGTITVVCQGAPFEITTFRRDVETDGRRAVVAFSEDISDDARRRDFTMNALYADLEGVVTDPLNGLPDLMARRIRFIEDANMRIKEDYLRTLRFFRFSAWYADPQDGFDPDALAAISENTDGLETLSAERVGQEFTKLMRAADPAPAIATMRQVGVLSTILPGTDDRWLAPLIHLEAALGVAPDWRARLAVLGGDETAVRLRLSKSDAKIVTLFKEQGFAGPLLAEVAYREGAEAAKQIMLLRAAMAERMPESGLLETISRAASAIFPIKAADLMPALQGPALGARLKALEAAWIASDFMLSADELLKLT
jgi:poly(A) polymerase/tRNA nucleotidyltransferase (CCA-adding enzyme)